MKSQIAPTSQQCKTTPPGTLTREHRNWSPFGPEPEPDWDSQARTLLASGYWEIYVWSPDTNEKMRIGHGSFASWSRDKRQIAIVDPRAKEYLSRVDANGEDLRVLVHQRRDPKTHLCRYSELQTPLDGLKPLPLSESSKLISPYLNNNSELKAPQIGSLGLRLNLCLRGTSTQSS